ncbi:hypothetical protein EG028_05900 [Chitinophaga barathri]|uniref:Transmembrane protein n=1 Tax=Chitinophaga barathri TaxID=1647451 RepID=A0A3N4MNR0_9BACT|nr:hypothetical protein EG028_05900 [Chitinophaga barathri]
MVDDDKIYIIIYSMSHFLMIILLKNDEIVYIYHFFESILQFFVHVSLFYYKISRHRKNQDDQLQVSQQSHFTLFFKKIPKFENHSAFVIGTLRSLILHH